MLKQSHSHRRTYLYDKVRRDIFEQDQVSNKKKMQIPSITTICLLQSQAYIIRLLANVSPTVNRSTTPTSSSSIYYLVQLKKMHTITSLKLVIRQCLEWVLLVILFLLDNVARLLNVEREISGLTREEPNDAATLVRRSDYDQVQDDEEEDFNQSSTDTNTSRDNYYMDHQQKKHYHHDPCANYDNNNAGTSEPTSPTVKRNNANGLVSPSSPMNSPTPNFVVRRRKTPVRTCEAISLALAPSRATRTGDTNKRVGHTDYPATNSTQTLRRIMAQREITVQNAELPIPPKTQASSKHHHHRHHHHTHKKPTVSSSKADSVASLSSSESSTATKEITVLSGHEFLHRPRMQKTVSLSTAQQYQQQQNEVKLIL
jgi:hypothetical protein